MLAPLSARRFHDNKGNRIDTTGLRYAPRALWTAVLRLFFGYRPALPWLSYRAIRELDALIRTDWRVLEFGSGMSTLWLARRCGFLHSIESDRGWYQQVSKMLARERLQHVRYELRDPARYADLRQYPDGYFDFVLVDGLARSECVRQALTKIRAGGWIYVDNIDMDLVPGGDMRVVESLLQEAVSERGGEMRTFVDFAPTQFFVNQGVLIQLSGNPAAKYESTSRPLPADKSL